MSNILTNQVIELLKIERECVIRQNGNGCQREKTNSCKGCDLVQSDDDIVKMYDTAIEIITSYNELDQEYEDLKEKYDDVTERYHNLQTEFNCMEFD